MEGHNIKFNKPYYVQDDNKNQYCALPVPGDGNYLFSSISYFLFHGDISLHGKLRNDCVNFINLHSLYFEELIENIDTYLINLSESNSWGGEIEIFCLSEIYKTRIEVFNFDPASLKVTPIATYRADVENDYSFKLMYYNNLHYWPLIEESLTILTNSNNPQYSFGSYGIENIEIIEEENTPQPDKSNEYALSLSTRLEAIQNSKIMKRKHTEKSQSKKTNINAGLHHNIINIKEHLTNEINNKRNEKLYSRRIAQRKRRSYKKNEKSTNNLPDENSNLKQTKADSFGQRGKSKEYELPLTARLEAIQISTQMKRKHTKKSQPKKTKINVGLHHNIKIKEYLTNEMNEKQNEKLYSRRIAQRKRRNLEKNEKIMNNLPDENSDLKQIKATKLQSNKNKALQTKIKKVNPLYNFSARCEYLEEKVIRNDLGRMNNICPHCNSKWFNSEQTTRNIFSKCCHNGKSILNFDFNIPEIIKNLLTIRGSEGQNFRKNIREFNSALAFASFGAKNIVPMQGRGPYCFKIQGIIYHQTSNLNNNTGNRKYAQLYIIDSDLACKERQQNRANTDCNMFIMKALDEVIRSINCYAQSFKMLHELEKEEQKKCQRSGLKPIQYSVWLLRNNNSTTNNSHKGRYNLPANNEIAAVFDDKEGCPPFLRDIEIHNRDGKHIKLSILSQHTDPMTYPLLYPYGGNGWYEKLASKTGFKVTQLQYYAYLLSDRDEFSTFLHSGKLTQQFIVDAYCKVEANRLNYLKTHQADLRVEFYQGLFDYLKNKKDDDTYKVGKSIILPSTFVGSPRNMAQNYQDAMTLVSRFGKPDLFITFTCNPKWKEIDENLKPYETAADRPDIVARVFHEKLKALMKELIDNQIFGKVTAFTYVIEFQKRGLPHCHMLIILSEEDKIRTSNDIDNIVCAEIPDEEKEPELYKVVLSCMIHGPCGDLNKNSPCMQGNICTKNYPKKFNETTQFNKNGYPHYRRRNDGKKMIIKNKDGTMRYEVDNRFIVPYNKYLSSKFNAHINVEVCSTIKSVKYLFKYVYKGHDCATITINSNDGENIIDHDEINSFVDTRYVSAPESFYRLYEYKMHDCSHAIIRLAIHLENMQTVCFTTGNEESAMKKSLSKNTTLTAWFELNKTDSAAKKYYYYEIPEHYVFDKKTGIWTKRKRFFNVIGRMYNVNVAQGERYFLRLMLLHQKGCTSFESLRTVDGIMYPTFKSAAIAMKLLDDDLEWDRALSEAEMYQLPKCLRQLFATICSFCNPSEPFTLWEKHAYYLSEDYIRRYDYLNDDNRTAYNCALFEINSLLLEHGKKCSDFQLPMPVTNNLLLPIDNNDNYNTEQEETDGLMMVRLLNEEQKNIYESIMKAIYQNSNETSKSNGKLFFIDAPGGTGKTFLYTTLMHIIRSKNDTVTPVAWTGIAASLLRGGRTVHSAFKLPVPLNETSTSSLKLNSNLAEKIKFSKLIIWDEVTMAPYYALDAVDKFLQELMNNKEAYGGKIMLFGGDFMQCLPVVKHGNRTMIIAASIKNSQN